MRLGAGECLKGIAARERGGEADALDAIGVNGLEVVMRSCKGCDTTTTICITDDSSMDGCLTDEAVTTIDGHGTWMVGILSANHKTFIYNRLVANKTGLQELDCSAIGWTAKCEMCR